jgi:hypothetical protein
VVTAYDKFSNESGYSNEVMATPQNVTSVPSWTNQSEFPEILIYPNPSYTGNITIESREMSGEALVILRDQKGSNVFEGKISGNRTEISAKGLKAGMYIVTVIGEKKTFHSKLIIQ